MSTPEASLPSTPRQHGSSRWLMLIAAFLIVEFTVGTYLLGRRRESQPLPSPAPASSAPIPAGWQRFTSGGLSLWLPKGWRVNPSAEKVPSGQEVSSFWEQLEPASPTVERPQTRAFSALLQKPSLEELNKGPSLLLLNVPVSEAGRLSGRTLFDLAVRTCACANGGTVLDKTSLSLGAVRGYRGIIESEQEGRALRQAVYILEVDQQLWLLLHSALHERFDEQLQVVKQALRTIAPAPAHVVTRSSHGPCVGPDPEALLARARHLLTFSPRDPIGRAKLACGLLHRGQVSHAVWAVLAAGPVDPAMVRASLYYHAGRRLLARSDYQEAASRFTSAIARGDDAASYAYRGFAYGQEQGYELAAADYERAIEQGLTHPALHYLRGSAYQNSAAQEQAVSDLTVAIDQMQDDKLLYYALYMRAWSNQTLGAHELVIQDTDRLLALQPSFGLGYWVRGASHSELGDRARALDDYDAALDWGVDEPLQLYYDRSMLNWEVAREKWEAARKSRLPFELNWAIDSYERAIADLGASIALQRDPDKLKDWYYWRVQMHEQRAAALEQAGRQDEARLEYQHIVDDVTTHIELMGPGGGYGNVYMSRGKAYAALGEYEKALQNYADSWKSDTPDDEAARLEGDALIMVKRYDKAIVAYGRAIGAKPENAEYHRLRAYAYSLKGSYGAAITNMDEAIRLAPDSAPYYAERAGFHREQRDLEAARADLARAAEHATTGAEKARYEEQLRALDPQP